MLKRLRWQLTLTYIMATLALVILIGGGSYSVLQRYLRTDLDLALGHGMAGQFRLFGLSLPESLQEVEEKWANEQERLTYSATNPVTSVSQPVVSGGEGEGDDDGEYGEVEASEVDEHGYGSSLISIFTMPLDASGALIFNPNPYSLPIQPNLEAFQAAMANGSDIRTVALPNGQRVRLLTYRTGSGDNPAAFQLGRIMSEQDLALRSLLIGILIISGASLVIVGLGSWRLAGRSILPAQQGIDQQQAFVANASHELRTPLTLIRASTEMALRKNPNREVSELLGSVIDEADYMNRLVDDLLLLSRLDAQQIKLDIAPVNIADLVGEITTQIQRIAEKKDIQVKSETIQKTILADATRLRQVLLIVLDNAINHTPAGGEIQLKVRQEARNLVITVRDNGEGIPQKHLPHIFERFYQVVPNFKGEQRSHGLGLSIAKNLVELHHGQIRAESAPGKGTTITITLPAGD